jgi:uncharacterized protein YxeA
MTTLLLIVILFLAISTAVYYFRYRKLQNERENALRERQETIEHYTKQAEVMQDDYAQRVTALEKEGERIKAFYEEEVRRTLESSQTELNRAVADAESLRRYASLHDAEVEVSQQLQVALSEAEALRQEAVQYLEYAKRQSGEERAESQQQAKEIIQQAEALHNQVMKEVSQMHEKAEREALQIAGDAHEAIRNKELLENSIRAIQNLVDGYGDRYVVPTRSILDELAADFGHLAAGESLRIARDESRQMVQKGEAAICDYVERERKDKAVRFVLDAFNGRVDAILSKVKSDNHGSLSQEIRDAFTLVNLNGQAFRNARILPSYLDSRLNELRWGSVAQELKRKEREEQRVLQEKIREEEKAQRDFERAQQEAAREEAMLKKAIEQARLDVERATAEEREKYAQKVADLENRLSEAEAKNQRALSMAQQTRSGNVYIISNIGSFGENILKIGMTRRLDPMDRVWELSNASVPFDFDVHAMISSEDAPTLERKLHDRFSDFRINKVNSRKEFFHIPLEQLRDFVRDEGLEATFTLAAEASEYRESLALANHQLGNSGDISLN